MLTRAAVDAERAHCHRFINDYECMMSADINAVLVYVHHSLASESLL